MSIRLAAVFVIACCSLSGVKLVAQTPATGSVAESIRKSWTAARTNITQSAELMPEANYAFKPVDSVRSFGAILAHIAGANYIFCSAAVGQKSPHAEDAFEKTATTRAAIVKALAESMAYCDKAFASLTDQTLGTAVDMPFDMGRETRAGALVANIGHLNEHYGNLVTYMRLKGIVPPSSEK